MIGGLVVSIAALALGPVALAGTCLALGRPVAGFCAWSA